MLPELVTEVLRLAPKPGLHKTAIPVLQVIRSDAVHERVHSLHKPALCFIAQGTKVVTIGSDVLQFAAGQFLYSSVDLPVSGEVIEATRKRPYLVLVLEVEQALVFELVAASRAALGGRSTGAQRGIFVDHDDALTEAFYRLLRCLRDPVDTHVLTPGVTREIVFRLLRGRYGSAVQEVGLADSHTQRIARVIEHLKAVYTKPQTVSELAKLAGMSTSSFHTHFRKVTTLTPLQYQKHLRLQEGRRLLQVLGTSAADAAFRVGYQSASQFNREYARYFGAPPMRDLKGSVERPVARPRSSTEASRGRGATNGRASRRRA